MTRAEALKIFNDKRTDRNALDGIYAAGLLKGFEQGVRASAEYFEKHQCSSPEYNCAGTVDILFLLEKKP